MSDHEANHLGMFEPLAALIRSAMDAGGLSQADVMRYTGLSRQTVSGLVNRKEPYKQRPPEAATQEALSRLPGLSIGAVQQAVARSMGIAIRDDRPEASRLRQTAHNMVDQIPETELQRVVQILSALI